jgi:hypothetical protein
MCQQSRASGNRRLARLKWTGEVDDHSFYFRERHAEWRIEIDLRPNGCVIRTVAGTDNDGATRYEERA